MRRLLHALGSRFGVDQSLEDGEDVASVFDHARENVAQRGFALRLAVPFEQHRLRNFDVPAKLFGGVAAQEQAVEEGRFPLRKVEIVLALVSRVICGRKRRVGVGLHQRLEAKGQFTGSFPGVKWYGWDSTLAIPKPRYEPHGNSMPRGWPKILRPILRAGTEPRNLTVLWVLSRFVLS